jgi:hypothetical protein
MMVVKVFADTSVPAGPITADTTWTQAGSPYIAAGSVLVMKDVTLTIEPGVEIRFGEGIQYLRACLKCRGICDYLRIKNWGISNR